MKENENVLKKIKFETLKKVYACFYAINLFLIFLAISSLASLYAFKGMKDDTQCVVVAIFVLSLFLLILSLIYRAVLGAEIKSKYTGYKIFINYWNTYLEQTLEEIAKILKEVIGRGYTTSGIKREILDMALTRYEGEIKFPFKLDKFQAEEIKLRLKELGIEVFIRE